MSTGTVEGGGNTIGRRGRPRGTGRGSRATRTGRGAATNRGRASRPGSGEVHPAPAEGRVGDGEREGRVVEGGGPAPGNVLQFRSFIAAGDQSGTTCGGCRATIAGGHRVVGLPCGRQYAMRAQCVVNAVRRRRGAGAASLRSKRMHGPPWKTGSFRIGSSGRPWTTRYGGETRRET